MIEGVVFEWVCRMFVGTWNVGGKSPNEGLNLREWLMLPSPADIYVMGYIILSYSSFFVDTTYTSFEFTQLL